MDILQTLDSHLDEWRLACKELALAVSSKDYKAYRRAFAKGEKSYTQIVDLHQDLPETLPDELKRKAQELSDDWLAQVSTIQEWQSEISEELNNMKKKRQGSSKVRKLFTQGRKSKGRNLKGTIH